MSRTLVAAVCTPGVTYCAGDGTPYRADPSGIVHMEAAHLTEISARTAPVGAIQPHQASISEVAGTSHKGAPLGWTSG